VSCQSSLHLDRTARPSTRQRPHRRESNAVGTAPLLGQTIFGVFGPHSRQHSSNLWTDFTFPGSSRSTGFPGTAIKHPIGPDSPRLQCSGWQNPRLRLVADVIGGHLRKTLKGCLKKTQRLLRTLLSRPVVLVAAVVSQVVVIGGTVWWAYRMGEVATGSLPLFPEAAIYVYVSDPRWQIAPSMMIAGKDEWALSLFAPPPPDPGDKAIVVLTGAARLTPCASCTYSMVFFPEIQLPSDPPPTAPITFAPRTSGRPHAGGGPSTVPAQVFELTGLDVYKFSLVGAPQPGLVTQTSSGWSAYVPALGSTAYVTPLPEDCHSSAGPLPDAIVKAVGRPNSSDSALANWAAALAAWDAQHSWYKGTCPGWEPGVHLQLGENEHLDRSSLPNFQTPNDISWDAHSEAMGHFPGRLPEFSVDIANPEAAAKAQQGLLFAGVLYGIAGGLAAAWLVAGVTFVVTKARRTDATG
jgi:hypothetical protein